MRITYLNVTEYRHRGIHNFALLNSFIFFSSKDDNMITLNNRNFLVEFDSESDSIYIFEFYPRFVMVTNIKKNPKTGMLWNLISAIDLGNLRQKVTVEVGKYQSNRLVNFERMYAGGYLMINLVGHSGSTRQVLIKPNQDQKISSFTIVADEYRGIFLQQKIKNFVEIVETK